MSENFMPSDEEISKAFEHDYYAAQDPTEKVYCPRFKALIRAAVEKATDGVCAERDDAFADFREQIKRLWVANTELKKKLQRSRLEATIEAMESIEQLPLDEDGVMVRVAAEDIFIPLLDAQNQLAALDQEEGKS